LQGLIADGLSGGHAVPLAGQRTIPSLPRLQPGFRTYLPQWTRARLQGREARGL
jgi:hypothetical protein